MFISRKTAKNLNTPFDLKDSEKISSEEFMSFVKNDKRYRRRSEADYHKFSYSFFPEERQDKLFTLEYFDVGIIAISGVDIEVDDLIVVVLSDVAIFFDALLLYNAESAYAIGTIQEAKERLQKRNNESKVLFQEESFGGNNMWLVIKSEVTEVRRFFNFNELKEKQWGEALQDMWRNKGVLVFYFRGYTILAGDLISSLFESTAIGEKAMEENQVKLLKEWSKDLNEVHFHFHYNRLEYMDVHYMTSNGSLLFGSYFTETHEVNYKRESDEIKGFPEWSIDPNYLKYCKELKNPKVWVVSI